MTGEEILYNAIRNAVMQDGAEPIEEPFEQTIQEPSFKILLSAMQEYADIESKKKAIAFSNWRQEYVNELTHEYMIYTKGSEPAILVNDESDLYQYFITNVYNQQL